MDLSRGDVSVQGSGMTPCGNHSTRSPSSLAVEAVTAALVDSGDHRIDAAFVGTVFGEMGSAQRSLSAAGIHSVPIVRIENACASGSTAYHEAVSAVVAGRYERVLVLGLEHMTSMFTGAITPEPRDVEGRTGLTLPSLYAMSAARYLDIGWVTQEELAAVAVKNRYNATLNPVAYQRSAVSVEQVLQSRPVSDPLTLLQCAPISDGAAAVVIGPTRPSHPDVVVRAAALRSGAYWGVRSEHVWGYDIVKATSDHAYAQAGLGPQDLDLVELHDAFTIGEIVSSEALGLAVEGAGGALAASGQTALYGRIPVNPSGGLIGRGHPLGCTGVAQIVEVVGQLRGIMGQRQLEGARIGLVETMGGGVSGLDGNACVVTILESPVRGGGA